MSDKRVFTIGQLVKVNLNNQIEVHYDTKQYRRVKRKIEWTGRQFEQNELVLAKITGVRTFQEGKYTAAYTSSGYMEPPENEEAYVSFDRSITTWALRLGYKNKELYYFVEDLEEVEFVSFKEILDSNKNKIDIPYFWTGGWSKEMRAKISRESEDWPRDKRGRWSKA
jgi:hypothetical protein